MDSLVEAPNQTVNAERESLKLDYLQYVAASLRFLINHV
jgi:hypothetical protein